MRFYVMILRDRIKRLKVWRRPLLPWRRSRRCQGSPRLLQRRSCDVLIEKIYYTSRDSRIQMNLTGVPRRSSTAAPGYLLRRRSLPLQLLVQSKFCRNLSPFVRTLILNGSDFKYSEPLTIHSYSPEHWKSEQKRSFNKKNIYPAVVA